MAESNTWSNKFRSILQKVAEQRVSAEAKSNEFITILVHDDAELRKRCNEVVAQHANAIIGGYAFDNVDECLDYIIEKVSSNEHVTIMISVGGQLVCDIVQSPVYNCDQVQLILITNEPPFKEEERELMKNYPKVNSVDSSVVSISY